MADPPRSSLVPGARVGGKYRLVRRLGTGAMGVVWAAVNEATHGEVAIKLIQGSEPEFRLRLEREARLCGQIKHRNVIDVYDVARTDDGDPFLVMQLLTGETLAQRIKRLRRLDPAEAALIARDISRALAVAHDKQIIHRDLKPANIFLQEDDDAGFIVKVLDFGVSKSMAISDGLNTVIGAAIGSLAYMSPEQARANLKLDARADLWSVGVVLYEMLSGVRPFEGPTPALMMSLIRGPTPSLAQKVFGLDEGLTRIVDRCLERDLGARIASARELARLLEPYAAPADRSPSSGEVRPPFISSPALPMSPAGPPMDPHPAPSSPGEDSTTAPLAPPPSRGGLISAPPAFDDPDDVTVRVAPRHALPARPAPAPVSDFVQGGTIRIRPEEAARLAPPIPRSVPPAPPPPPVELPPDARQTVPLRRPLLPLRAALPEPFPPSPPLAPRLEIAAPARGLPPQPGPLLAVFIAAAVVTLLLTIAAYLFYSGPSSPPLPPPPPDGG